MQRLFFVGCLLVAGTVFGQYALPPAAQQPRQQQPLQTPPKWMTVDGVPVQPHGPQLGPAVGLPPVRIAQTHPAIASTAPTTLVGPDGRQLQHMGRSEPEFRVVPFVLNPAEQKELDEFLIRWEQFSGSIKSFEVNFTCYEYMRSLRADGPVHTTFGYFKHRTPRRFVFHVEGQWIDGKQVRRSPKEEKIIEEKIIIDGNTIFEYDFNAETVRRYDLDPAHLARGFADSPLPLIFGAKAAEMKQRFSMKIVTAENFKDEQVWLQVRPLTIADQKEFRALEIRIDRKTLRATALKKEDIVDGAYRVFVLDKHTINSPFDAIRDRIFTPDVPSGMTLVVVKDLPSSQSDGGQPRTAGPPPNPQPPLHPTPPNPGNEIKLY